ncbi:MAG TPA: hypothetical protein VN257_09515 [Actinotalea sp.]|nr:hypothetical protein [Actinotalea sp.]
MELVKDLTLVLHFLGLASLLGGFLVQIKPPVKVVNAAMFHGVLTQLVTGLMLVGIEQALDPEDVNNAKVAVKLVVLLVITALVLVGRRKESISTRTWALIGGLTVLNVVIAVLW